MTSLMEDYLDSIQRFLHQIFNQVFQSHTYANRQMHVFAFSSLVIVRRYLTEPGF
jgi:hypothetical protein